MPASSALGAKLHPRTAPPATKTSPTWVPGLQTHASIPLRDVPFMRLHSRAGVPEVCENDRDERCEHHST